MKILFFTDTFYDANGVSRFLQDMAGMACESDFEITILTSSRKTFGNQNLPNVINISPFFYMKMPFYSDLDLTFPLPKKLFNIFHKIDPDIVHVSTPGYVGLIGRYLAKKHNKILTGTYHTNFPAYIKKNTNSTLAYNLTLKFMKYFYKPFSLVFSRSDEYMYYLKKYLKLSEDKIQILPYGIDIQTFTPNTKYEKILNQLPSVSSKDINVLYVGRFTKEKNFPFLIRVWKKFYFLMKKQNKKATLICVGEGRYMKQKKQLKAYNVFLINKKPKEELPFFYSFADFFLFPSTTDTLGQVVMESLACKTAVIVSDKGGPKNIVKNGDKPCGIIKKIDENLWIDAMVDLALNDKKRENYAKNGFEMMQKHSIINSFEIFIKSHEDFGFKD